MAKIIAFFKKCIDGIVGLYDKFLVHAERAPLLAAILVGTIALAFIIIIILICKASKNKRARKRAQAQKAVIASTPTVQAETKKEVTVTEVKPEPVKEVKAEPVKEVKPEPVKEVKAEPVKEVKPELVKEVKPEPVKEVKAEPVKEVKAEPVKEVKAEPVKEVKAEPVKEVKPEPVKEVKPEPVKEVKPEPVKEVKPEPVVEEANTEPVVEEKASLIDELKDSLDGGIDFYEESEADKAAKYAGKWTICRMITEDTEETEEAYFFELYASNGEKLLSSEEYTTYAGALRGIETHKKNILQGNFKVALSKKGDYIFKLLSGKNMLLCMGENYPSKARCESAIESTKRFAKTAILDENVQDHVIKIPVEDDSEIAPLPDGYNGKWLVSDAKNAEGEQVFYFELFANNGEKLLSSEEYTTYIGAINGINTHKANIARGNFRVSLTKRGDYIYKLLNANGQLLCLGEHYKTKRRCLNAVESVKRFAANSPLLVSPYLTK